MVLSLSLDRLLVNAPVIKVVIMRRGSICTSLIGIGKWSRQAHYNGNIRLKERPQKRHIGEILSGHSLSSYVRPFALGFLSLSFCDRWLERELHVLHHQVTSWRICPSDDDACLACPFPFVRWFLVDFHVSSHIALHRVQKKRYIVYV